MTSPVCPQHGTTPNSLCHVQQATPPSDRQLRTWGYGGPDGRHQYERDALQQAHPADDGMTWQAIRDVLLAGAVVAAILYPLFVWLLSLAPAPVPR